MNKIIRFISIILLGIVGLVMLIAKEPFLPGGRSAIEFVKGEAFVGYLLPGLLIVSAFLCLKRFGFKNKKVFRVLVGLLFIAVPIATRFVPGEIALFGFTLNLPKLVLGGGYAVAFFFLFFLHLLELGSRKGASKFFAPLADLALVVYAPLLYVNEVIPEITQAPFYQYIEYGLNYGHLVVGGLLTATFVFALLELFLRKPAKQ